MSDSDTVLSLSEALSAKLASLSPEAKEKLLAKVLKKADAKRVPATEIEAKYSHVIPGSLVWDEVAEKQAVQIRCSHPECSETRRVFTSDLFQVRLCVPHKTEARRAAKVEERELLKALKAQVS